MYECSVCKTTLPASKVGYCRVCEDVVCEQCACICDLCKELVCYKYTYRCSCAPYCGEHLCGEYCPPCYWGTNTRFWGEHQQECERCDECGVPVPIHCTIDADDDDDESYDNTSHQEWHEDDSERFPYRAANWRPSVPIVTNGTFEDPDFEWEVRLGLNNFQDPLAFTDLRDLKSLHIFPNYQFKSIAGTVRVREIKSIAGLEHAVNITSLTIDGVNQITDLSPISGLDKLESLHVRNHFVSDLSFLAKLTKLTTLWIECSQVTDLTPLENFPELQQLFIDNTSVSDLSPLSTLNKLEWIRLRNTKVDDLSPIEPLSNLKRLEVKQPFGVATQAILRSFESRGVYVGNTKTEQETQEDYAKIRRFSDALMWQEMNSDADDEDEEEGDEAGGVGVGGT